MDLREFIKTTMLSIHDAMIDIEKSGGGKFDLGEDVKRKQGVDHGTIHFDIAVVAGGEKEVSGKAGAKASFIKVVGLEGNASATSSTKDESTSRISFDLVRQMTEDRKYSTDPEPQ